MNVGKAVYRRDHAQQRKREKEKREIEYRIAVSRSQPQSQAEADRRREDWWDYPGDSLYARGRDDEGNQWPDLTDDKIRESVERHRRAREERERRENRE